MTLDEPGTSLPAAPPIAEQVLGDRLDAMEHYVAILATRGSTTASSGRARCRGCGSGTS